MKPIALIGYMGSGKTHWGRLLSNALNESFLDLDDYLEFNHLHRPINTFIETKGELPFRKKERAALYEICKKEEKIVLATGGGTPVYYDNMEYLNKHFTTVYLDCSIKTLANRLKDEKVQRPLLTHIADSELQEFIAKHLFERRHIYLQSNIVIKADALELNTLIQQIKSYEATHH